MSETNIKRRPPLSSKSYKHKYFSQAMPFCRKKISWTYHKLWSTIVWEKNVRKEKWV